jgi:hypothetical protein
MAAFQKNCEHMGFKEAKIAVTKLVTELEHAMWSDDLRRRLSRRQYQQVFDRLWSLHDRCNRMGVDYFVRHEHWIEAGVWPGWLHEGNWDTQVYYWRKAGREGQRLIADCACQRLWTVLRRSAEDAMFLNDYHLPRFERYDMARLPR